ncbi:MAG: signal recognition particle protein [Xanthomonadales bacterium]|nr:signal recognition particle protein [Xanthomonadales bacterium]
MFKNLSDRLSDTLKKIRGQARITEDNITDALRDVRVALLEADVALPVVRSFTERVKQRAIGQEVLKSLSPGQAFVKVVQDELIEILGGGTRELNLRAQPPAVVLMAGLQGSGKTTTTAKLAKLLRERENKKVMVVSCDVHRPAAIEQLRTLAEQVKVEFHHSQTGEAAETIAARALEDARRKFMDVLLVDTAGRLAIDQEMMAEVQRIHAAVTPVETLFVVDAMTGQDAANTASAFNDALSLTGVVLTKVDGDARGGAALSVSQVVGQPIKYLGTGEKTDGLEPFHPERIASRILGMGDVLSLVEEVQRKVDQDKAEKLAKKITKGRKFDLTDFKEQLEQMVNMGGMASLMDKLPGMGQIPDAVKAKVDDSETRRMIAIINSMTPKERRFPDLMSKGSRKRRVAAGSGTQIQDVNRLMKQYNQMQRMMKKFGKGGMKGLMKKMKGRMPPGGMPPGGMPPGGLPPGFQ